MQHHPYMDSVLALSEETGLSTLAVATAMNRGLQNARALLDFVHKLFEQLHNPMLMKDMDKAVARISMAIARGEKIVVYGDYDVDGITSVSVLTHYLRSCGARVDYYIPGRMEEGYGVNRGAIDKIKALEAGLIITVDTGTTAVEECEYIQALGMDVIITDHHRCKEKLPVCVAVVNPQQEDCPYPFKNLAGVGVVFKLLCAHCKDDKKVFERYGDLITIGTIADVVSLHGENRIIVHEGLALVSNTKNMGLRALIEACCIRSPMMGVGNIGFSIAPRINAAGRVGSASKAVSLFLSDDDAEAEAIAKELCSENRSRQEMENEIMAEAIQMIENNPALGTQKVIVLWKDGWHHGVIGIVASRISEKYYRPCILIGVDNEAGKGSGRSIKGFNLFEALRECSDLVEKFGGHELAAGLSIHQENIHKLSSRLNSIANDLLGEVALEPTLYIDCELPKECISLMAAEQLSILEPFGTGNPQPCFSISDCIIRKCSLLSVDKHIAMVLEKENAVFEAVGFSLGGLYKQYREGDVISVAGAISVNEYHGRRKLQFIIKDVVGQKA